MNNKLWRNIVLIFFFVYGPFLVFESLVDVWPTEQMHSVSQFIGGIAMLLWGVRYFIKRPKAVVYAINAFVIAVIAGLCVLLPILVVMALI